MKKCSNWEQESIKTEDDTSKGRGDSMLIPAQQKDPWDKDSWDKNHNAAPYIQHWGPHDVFLESSLPSLM